MGFFGRKEEKDNAVVDAMEPNSTNLKEKDVQDIQDGPTGDNADNLQRHLGNRQIQLIAIGGSIGTALFVSIGTGLYNGGPGSLFLAFTIQSSVLAMVNNCLAEMNTAYPVSGGFIRLAGKWVDDALGFMIGWNFLLVALTLSLPSPSPMSHDVLIADMCCMIAFMKLF